MCSNVTLFFHFDRQGVEWRGQRRSAHVLWVLHSLSLDRGTQEWLPASRRPSPVPAAGVYPAGGGPARDPWGERDFTGASLCFALTSGLSLKVFSLCRVLSLLSYLRMLNRGQVRGYVSSHLLQQLWQKVLAAACRGQQHTKLTLSARFSKDFTSFFW